MSMAAPPKGQLVGPPVNLGYPPPPPPPPPGCHGYGQPCPGYPDPSHHYSPTMPPPNPAYYPSSQLPYLYHEKRSVYTFARFVLCTMIMMIIGAAMMSILMWYVFGSDIPKFQVASFAVPVFNVSNSSLTAIWEANVTIENPNHKFLITFDQVESSLGYRDALLDAELVENPLQLRPDGVGTLPIKFQLPSSYHNTTNAFWLKDIDDDRKKGSVVFDLRIIMVVTFTSDDVSRRQTILKTLCGDLKVNFPAPTGGGVLNGGKQDCILFI